MKKCIIVKIKALPLCWLATFFLCVLLLAIVCGLKLGFTPVDSHTLVSVLTGALFNISPTPTDTDIADIIWQLRMPRLLLAASVGMALSLSGIVLQAAVQNPLADPYILGVSSGASLGATAAIFLGLGTIFGPQAIGFCAFIGAMAISATVLFIAGTENNNAVKLLLSGMALNAVCSSLSGFIIYIGRSKEGMEAVTYWLLGNVANAVLSNVFVLIVLLLPIFFYFLSQRRTLNLMLLGRDSAITLGIDINRCLPKFLLLNSLMIGFVVLNAGMIGFIGLIIPHITRACFGANHQKTLPIAVISGGIFSIIMDILSRTILPGIDIPIGIMFAIIGAPCFIYLMLQKQYRFGGN